jgi:hypothetical protein
MPGVLRHCISGQGSSLRCLAAILFLLGLALRSVTLFTPNFEGDSKFAFQMQLRQNFPLCRNTFLF